VDAESLSTRLTAIASAQRMRIIALLAGEKLHVSELARRVGMSRALLYMHLTKLEEAGFVAGHLELSDDGKALKYAVAQSHQHEQHEQHEQRAETGDT
jgi:DNA-binding transcriptional ArsR family regulator